VAERGGGESCVAVTAARLVVAPGVATAVLAVAALFAAGLEVAVLPGETAAEPPLKCWTRSHAVKPTSAVSAISAPTRSLGSGFGSTREIVGVLLIPCR
jgi:hypothetical protein